MRIKKFQSICIIIFLFAPLCHSSQDNPVGLKTKEIKPTLSLTIRCDQKELKACDEIPIIFSIKNEGTTEYSYANRNYDRSGRMPEYELSAVDEQGNIVPDPRATWTGGIGGGLYGQSIIKSGESFSRTITLNRWALLVKPGTYQVTGTYRVEGNFPKIVTSPIQIKVLPRTNEEMGIYINKLRIQLSEAKDGQERAVIVRRIMYTCDSRVIPILIEAIYKADAASYWAEEAFHYYLPHNQETNDALLDAAKKRGLAIGMLWTLRQRGFTGEQIKSLIDVSLAPERPDAWIEGALAAQEFPEDRFMPRLISIALDPESPARSQAIYALARNCTNESVATLKKLLNEPDPPEPKGRTIRQTTESAIRTAYWLGDNVKGRPLRKDDFDLKYQDTSNFLP